MALQEMEFLLFSINCKMAMQPKSLIQMVISGAFGGGPKAIK
jgi:hypothetical protein